MASTSEQLIELAKQYASEKGLGYLGALTPKEAWELLNTNENAVLIDVRSPTAHREAETAKAHRG